jgi:hypothetical protein
MPRNFKEEIVFTAIMAGLMVLVMVGYNVVLAEGSLMTSCCTPSRNILVACSLPLFLIC